MTITRLIIIHILFIEQLRTYFNLEKYKQSLSCFLFYIVIEKKLYIKKPLIGNY